MVKIISDSTCDLSQALIEKYDITILPLHILLGDKEYRDGADITPEEIFAWSDENKTTPKTSAPSLVEAVECLRSYVEAKTEVICFSISASDRFGESVNRNRTSCDRGGAYGAGRQGCTDNRTNNRGIKAARACQLRGRYTDLFI